MQRSEASAVEPLQFPDGVGVIIGQKTQLRYAVLQVHNNRPLRHENTRFELTVKVGVKEPNRVMITQMMPWAFSIPPRRKKYRVTVDSSTYRGKVPLDLWAVHSHFHEIGTSVHFKISRGDKTVLRYA